MLDISFAELGGRVTQGTAPARGLVIFYNGGASRKSAPLKEVEKAAEELERVDKFTVMRVPLPSPDDPAFSTMFPFRTTPTCILTGQSTVSRGYISGPRSAEDLRVWAAMAPMGAVVKEEDSVRAVLESCLDAAADWVDAMTPI